MLQHLQPSKVSPSQLFAAPDDVVPKGQEGLPAWLSLEAWANSPGPDQDIRAALASKVNYITFPALKAALSEVVTSVNNMVTRERLTPTLLLGRNEWCSNNWVTKGISPALQFTPAGSGFLREMGMRANQSLVEDAQSKGSDTFILFDDAVFSGQQIEMDLAQQLKMVGTYLPPEQAERLYKSRIILAPAFATAHGKAHALESCDAYGFTNVSFVTGTTPILTLCEIFDRHFIERVKKWRKHGTRAPIDHLSLTLFEHGCPDDESSLSEVTQRLGRIQKPYRPGFQMRMF